MTDDLDIVGVAEIAAMLGVTRQRVFQLSLRPDFPEPWRKMSAATFWRTSDVQAWAEATGREWRPRAPKPPPSDEQ